MQAGRVVSGSMEWGPPLFAAAWLAVFLALLLSGASPAPPDPRAFPALAAAGLVYGVAFRRADLAALLARHRVLLGAALAFVLAVGLVEGALAAAGLRRSEGPLPAQLGMLLCLPSLALFLQSRRSLQALALVFAALCLWHVATLPVEAVTGVRLGWTDMPLIPRPWGPLRFQASGLAWQVYFFAGIHLAMFFIALGLVAQEALWPRLVVPAGVQFALGCIWLAAIAALQSRSAFAGVLAATLLGGLASLRASPPRKAVVTMLATAAGVLLFWLLFSGGKSPPRLRGAYLQLFVQRSLEWPWILTGRSYSVVPDGGMAVPGVEFLPHSHNDFVQVLFFWGLPVLLLYLLFWGALLRLVWTAFWRQGHRWPLLAIVSVAPGFATDLGFHLYEKAAFLVLLAGLCMALAGPRPPLRP